MAQGRTPEPEVVVALEHVSFAFDDHVVLQDVSFEIQKGRMSILLGESGSGKSVLLKLVLGLLRSDAGRIYVNGQRIDTMSERDLLRTRADIGMAFQELALFDSLTVNENVGYRLYEETDTPPDQVRRRVQEVLDLVGLGEYLDRMPSELSGGQRRRVAIARALASEPNLMLLDDPTTGLDPIIATTVDDAIVTLRDVRQVTALLATHQIRDAFHIATHRAVRVGHDVRIVDAGQRTRAPERRSWCCTRAGFASRARPTNCSRRRIPIFASSSVGRFRPGRVMADPTDQAASCPTVEPSRRLHPHYPEAIDPSKSGAGAWARSTLSPWAAMCNSMCNERVDTRRNGTARDRNSGPIGDRLSGWTPSGSKRAEFRPEFVDCEARATAKI